MAPQNCQIIMPEFIRLPSRMAYVVNDIALVKHSSKQNKKKQQQVKTEQHLTHDVHD